MFLSWEAGGLFCILLLHMLVICKKKLTLPATTAVLSLGVYDLHQGASTQLSSIALTVSDNQKCHDCLPA